MLPLADQVDRLLRAQWLTLPQLMAACGCTRSPIRHAVAWLARDRVIFRRRNPDDRRSRQYRILPQAFAVQAVAEEQAA